MGRTHVWASVLTLGLAASVGLARANEVDSEHLFGFTEGTDIGEQGEREVEVGAGAGIGKRRGHYFVGTQTVEIKYPAMEWVRFAPGLAFSHFNIGSVPGLDDSRIYALSAFTFETKARVLDRTKSPFGLTLTAIASGEFRDRATGAKARGTGFDFAVLLDRELVQDKLFGALNVTYETGTLRPLSFGPIERDSAWGISAALSLRATEQLFLGGEIRYAQAFEGAALNTFAGEAVFLGPTVYYRLSKEAWISAAWSTQVAGHAYGDRRVLDLTNFERHQAKVRAGYSF